MKKQKVLAAAVATVALGMVSHAMGSALVDFTIVGSTNFSSTATGYSGDVTAASGTTVYYAVEAELAPVGTSYTNHSGTVTTISELTPGGTNGTSFTGDGITSLSYNLTDGSATFQTYAVVSPWNGSGSSNGSLTAGGVSNAFSIVSPSTNGPQGVATNNTPSVVLLGEGTLVMGSSGSTVAGAYGETTGGFRVNNGGFKPSISSTDPNGYTTFSDLDLTEQSTSIISLTAGQPSGYGNSLGSVTISGEDGSYKPGKTTFSPTTSGYVQINSFSPSGDREIYAIDVTNATAGQLSDIVTDIDNAGLTASTNWSTISAGGNPFIGDFAGGTDVYVEENPGVGTNPYLGLNFGNDTNLSGATFSGIAAVPEPTSGALLLGLGAVGLLRRGGRRKTEADADAE